MTPKRMRDELVTVFGGSGFVGRYVVRTLARRGYRVRVAVRRPELAGFLRPLGAVGQIHAVQANVRHPGSVAHAVRGSDAVVNLVAILHESGRQRFNAVHVAGAEAIAKACRDAGVERLAHVSAIGADPDSDSIYARTKAAGEDAVFDAVPEAVIMRPSVVIGPEDGFFNRFASMARLSPVLPLIGGGHTRFQPVYVGDVAEAIARAVEGETAKGTIFELGGPEVKTFRELMEIMLDEIGRKRILLSIPVPLARLMARFLQVLPKPVLTLDQVRQLGHDNIVSEAAERDGRTLEGLGVAPHAMALVIPGYLQRYRRAGQFSRRNEEADQT